MNIYICITVWQTPTAIGCTLNIHVFFLLLLSFFWSKFAWHHGHNDPYLWWFLMWWRNDLIWCDWLKSSCTGHVTEILLYWAYDWNLLVLGMWLKSSVLGMFNLMLLEWIWPSTFHVFLLMDDQCLSVFIYMSVCRDFTANVHLHVHQHLFSFSGFLLSWLEKEKWSLIFVTSSKNQKEIRFLTLRKEWIGSNCCV